MPRYAQKGNTKKAEDYYYASDSIANELEETESEELMSPEDDLFEPQTQEQAQALDDAFEEINANYRRQGEQDKEIELRNRVVENATKKQEANYSIASQKNKIAADKRLRPQAFTRQPLAVAK